MKRKLTDSASIFFLLLMDCRKAVRSIIPYVITPSNKVGAFR
jgi:hypothetical protein